MIKKVFAVVISLYSVAFSEGSLTVVMTNDGVVITGGKKFNSKFVFFSLSKLQREKGELPLYVSNSYDFFVVDSLGNEIPDLQGTFYLPHKKLCFRDYEECRHAPMGCCQNIPKDWPNIDSLFTCCGKEIVVARRIPPDISVPKSVYFKTLFDYHDGKDFPEYI